MKKREKIKEERTKLSNKFHLLRRDLFFGEQFRNDFF